MSPTREAVYDAIRALDAVVEAACAARRRVEELLVSTIEVGSGDSVQTAALAPVISIVDAKASDDGPEGVDANAALAASVRANPHLYPHLPDFMKR